MKKIIIATATLGGGGAERAFINIANQLVEMGNDVRIMTSGSRSVESYKVDERIKIDNIVTCKKNKIFRIIDKFFQFRNYIRDHKEYTIISFFPDVSAYCVLASMGLKVRNIVSERNDPNTIPRKKYMKRIRNWAFKYASCCVFQTVDAKNYFPASVRNKSVVIPNPLNVGILPMPIPIENRKKIIIAVGRIVPQKNFLLLVKAWAEVAKKYPDWVINIYGDTTYHNGIFTQSIQKEIVELGVDNSVFFKGFSDKIYNCMNEASIYISTSDFEGMSNTMLEAMAIGTPTIATDCPIGGAKAIIQDKVNGILVKVGDVNSVSNAISTLIEDVDLRKKLSKESVKLRHLLTINNICEQWLEII